MRTSRRAETTADELLTRARSDPKAVLAEAPGLLDALSGDDHARRAVVLRAMGLAARWAGTVEQSADLLRKAIEAADSAGDERLCIEATLSLSGTLAIAGDMHAALDTLRSAPAIEDASLSARVSFQIGSIYARMARPDQALAAWDRALPTFRRDGDRLREAMTLRNRGFLNAFSGDLNVAEHDLRRARALFAELGVGAELAGVELNLGIVALYRGDLPLALQRFDAAESKVAELTGAPHEIQVSHCEALLSAGLYADAVRLATNARRQMLESGLGADAAEATLVLAAALLKAGKTAEAKNAADDATQLFEQQGRSGWSAHARYLSLLAGYGSESPTRTAARRARRLAAELESAGQYIPAAGAHLIAGRIELDAGGRERARRDLYAVASHRVAGPVEVSIQSWLALALIRRAEGNLAGADAAARAGLRALAAHQATLGATDVRTGVADHGRELGQIGLELAGAASDNARLLRWMERTRASALRLRPVTPPADPELAAATTELRRLTHGLRNATPEETASLRRRQVQLQRTIAARTRRVAGDRSSQDAALVDVASLKRVLGDRTLVELADIDGELVAVVVRNGRVLRRRVGDSRRPREEIESLRLLMRRAARSPEDSASWQLVASVAERLDAGLLAPLSLGEGPLVLVPPADLYSVPWSLLPSCQGRAVTVAPSATVWRDAAQSSPAAAGAVFAAGPRLAHASAEVREVARLYPGAARFNSRQSSVARIIAAMDGAVMVHLACHGSFSADNPMFSSLQLADGDLTVYDLERLHAAPETVVLSACESGVSSARSGDELLGLATAFHSLGTRNLVASVGLVPDSAATRRFIMRFHGGLVDGLAPSAALVAAHEGSRSRDEIVAAASFVCFGAG